MPTLTTAQIKMNFLVRLASVAAAIPTGAAPDPAEVRRRLMTLAKTLVHVSAEAPEEALPLLQKLAAELAEIRVTPTLSAAGLVAVLELQSRTDQAIAGLPVRASALVRGHADEWNRQIAGMLAKPVVTLQERNAVAAASGALITRVENGLVADRGLMTAFRLPPVAVALDALRAHYLALQPQRTLGPTGLPVEPVPLADAGRPAVGALDAAQRQRLEALLTGTEGRMSKDKEPKVEDIEAAVALIRRGLDAPLALAAMRQHKTWVALKEESHRLAKVASPEAGQAFMAMMWWFRRMEVDALMATLQRKYEFTWGCVGGSNPESDYDLTVRTHGVFEGAMKWDYQIVAEFNQTLSAKFDNTPPGILFDTNLYAEASVSASAPGAAASPEVLAARRDMTVMKDRGQDVGALMKLRRFMEWDEYEGYRKSVLAAIVDVEKRKLAEKQFDEADGLFFKACAAQLKEAGVRVDDIQPTVAGQRALLERVASLEHDASKVMSVNNAIYEKRMTVVRKLEAAYHDERDEAKRLQILAVLRTMQAETTFFAAEAYHSEGPLLHVVKAGQSSKLEIAANGVEYATSALKNAAILELKQQKLAAYSPTQMLQSLNENLGDLLKDLRHYSAEPSPGLGFYRSSKYVERLCDAAVLMSGKLQTNRAKMESLRLGGKTPAEVQGALAKLVDIRGDKIGFAAGAVTDPEQEKQAFAVAEMKKIFPSVATLGDLGRLVTAFCAQVNSLVRAEVAEQAGGAVGEAGYFGAAPPSRPPVRLPPRR